VVSSAKAVVTSRNCTFENLAVSTVRPYFSSELQFSAELKATHAHAPTIAQYVTVLLGVLVKLAFQVDGLDGVDLLRSTLMSLEPGGVCGAINGSTVRAALLAELQLECVPGFRLGQQGRVHSRYLG
jgi:hypothetical protein